MNALEARKKYYSILADDPDYPAWQDFEVSSGRGHWERITEDHKWRADYEYRHSVLPKKWEPKDGWAQTCRVNISIELTDQDYAKLQAYATKLSWLRENGGYEFEEGKENFLHEDNDSYDKWEVTVLDDGIYMDKEQAEKWLEMLNKGEV